MKKYMVILPLSAITLFVALPKGADAQIAIAEVIKAGIKKVIKAADLKVQRLQNKTIWLQNAQKVLENQLSKLKLAEIADWTKKQKDLYGKYYEELWTVKSAIAYYGGIKDLTQKQVAIVEEYNRVWNLFRQDKNFSAEELNHMQDVYAGLLKESVNNLDEILAVAHSFKTQMSDASRLEIIGSVSGKIDDNYNDLYLFGEQNIQLSIQRAKSIDEINILKKLYGID